MSESVKATITVGNTVVTFEGPQDFVDTQVSKYMGGSIPSNNGKHIQPIAESPELKGSAGDVQEQSETIPQSAPARILALKQQGFFSDQRGISEIRDELQTHGWRYDITSLSGTLMKLVRSRELRRAKVNDGSKSVYKYFNP